MFAQCGRGELRNVAERKKTHAEGFDHIAGIAPCNRFGHRTAASISHANEEYANFSFFCHVGDRSGQTLVAGVSGLLPGLQAFTECTTGVAAIERKCLCTVESSVNSGWNVAARMFWHCTKVGCLSCVASTSTLGPTDAM